MRIYVALYDPQFNVMITLRREMTRWWGKKVTPTSYLLDEPEHPSLIFGETSPADTYISAARRLFQDKTGYPIPIDHVATKMHLGDDYVLVCFRVTGLRDLQENINKGLMQRYDNGHSPTNRQIVDWEFTEVQCMPRSDLGFQLGRIYQDQLKNKF